MKCLPLLVVPAAAAADVLRAVAVSSGTAALPAALAGYGIGPGDEVLLPAVSVIMPLAAVTATGARPVLVDAGPGGEPVDLDDLAAKITPGAGRCCWSTSPAAPAT